MPRALLLAVLVALLAATSATAATPAQYRAHLNGICRGYTPKLQTAEMAMAAAGTDAHAYGLALGKLLVLGLAQDVQLERVPVPAALTTRMTPILTTLKRVDVHIRAALAFAKAGNGQGMLAELKTIAATGGSLNTKLDAAGLRDCGSKQQ